MILYRRKSIVFNLVCLSTRHKRQSGENTIWKTWHALMPKKVLFIAKKLKIKWFAFIYNIIRYINSWGFFYPEMWILLDNGINNVQYAQTITSKN